MARTKMNQRSASRVDVPMGATGGRTPPSKVTVLLLLTCALSVIWALSMLTWFGRVAYYYFYAYSEYYMGVISLVALSTTIMIGLVATDRLVLSIRQRVLLQSAHRTTGLIAVVALVIHVWTKLMESHIRLIDVIFPFLAPYHRLFIGLGTMSGWIMFLVMWTGLARTRFIGRGKPWMWRSVHAVSYLMWPLALVHGLSAGRPAATWVVVSYIICVLGVLVGLAVRLSVSLNRRKDFSSTSTGTIKPVGSLVPAGPAAPARAGLRKRGRRDDDEPREPGPAPMPSWVPAAAPPVSPAPVAVSPAPRPRRYEEEPVAARSGRIGYDDAPIAPRSRRATPAVYDDEFDDQFSDEPVAPRPRRRPAAERYDEPTRTMSPGAHGWANDDPDPDIDDEEAPPRGRRHAEESLYQARRVVEESRAGRYAAEVEEDEPRGRRYRDDEPAPRGRRRPAETEETPPRGRRYADGWADDWADVEPAEPRARRRADEARSLGAQSGEFRTGELRLDQTGEFRADDGYAPPRRSRRYADEDAGPPPRSRRRDDSGRHSRTDFADLDEPADPWAESDYPPPDETPTLVDMASRRERRAAQPDAGRGPAGRGPRRGRSRAAEDVPDEAYWRQLRGEAQ